MYISGIRGGKTFSIACFVTDRSKIKGSIGIIAAPSYTVLKTGTLKGFIKALGILGYIKGIDYVVNTIPPKEWGIDAFSEINNWGIITWKTGSYTVIASLDNPDSLRGAEYDYACIDEFRDIKFDEVTKVIKGRMSGAAFPKLSLPIQILWTSTPPENVRYLKEYIDKNELHLIQGTTLDNKANLPDDYLDGLNYDQRTYDREVLGKIVDSYTDNLFAYEYQEDYHCIDFEDYGIEIDPAEPLRLSFDFNVNPMTCIAGQSLPDGIRIFKAFSDPNSNTAELCRKIKAWMPYEMVIQVTGDANGFARNASSDRSSYQVIIDELYLTEHQILAPRSNPSHKDSQVLCNSILQNFDMRINRPECPELNEDLKYVTMKEGVGKKEIDKKKHGAHSLDNWRYYLHTWHWDFIKFRHER